MSAVKAGRELDALIAEKVMGDVRLDPPVRLPNGVTYRWKSEGEITPEPPPYSTDIGAAWLVVGHLRDAGLRPVLMPDWHRQWQCVVYRKDKFIAQSEFLDSAPEAICRAAFQAFVTESVTRPAEAAE